MKWSTAAGVVALLSTAAIGARSIFVPERTTPVDTLERIRERADLPSFDARQALRDLDRALLHPVARGDDALSVELHMERARLFRSLGAYGDARGEIERVSAVYRPDDRALDLMAAELWALEGRTSDALNRVQSMLKADDSNAAAWQLRGDLEVRRGEELLRAAREMIDEDLVADESLHALAIADQIGSRDLNDPSRARLEHELRSVYTERRNADQIEVMDALDQVSIAFSRARESLAESFSRGVDPEALRNWIELHTRAGRPELAVDLGSAAQSLQDIREDPEVLAGMLEAMADLQQADRMHQLAATWPWDSQPAELEVYRRAVDALYRAGNLKAMRKPLKELNNLGVANDRLLFYFFSGMASFAISIEERELAGSAGVENPQEHLRKSTQAEESAKTLLSRFLDSQAPEPVPGARTDAWSALAQIAREQVTPREELVMIHGLINEDPSQAGEAYLRKVELQSNMVSLSPREPEINWTKGMALLPKRAEELMDNWARLGRQSLEASDLDFEEVYGRIIDQGLTLPAHKVGPYTLFLVAQRHLLEDNVDAAGSVARELLLEYPGLMPARDLAIEAAFGRNNWFVAREHVLERLRDVGPADPTREWIMQLPPEVLTPENRLEIMRLDPYGLGRLTVAQRFLDRGEPQRALLALRVVAGVPDLDEVVLMRGHAMHAVERHLSAAEEVLALVDHPNLGLEARDLAVRALLAHGSGSSRERALDLLKVSRADRELRMEIAQLLVHQGAHEQAAVLLESLNAEPETRGGDVFLLIALSAAMQDDLAAAYEALERAEPFTDDGVAETLRVILLTYERDWAQLGPAMDRLSNTHPRSNRQRETITLLLDERLEEGLDLARVGVAKSEGDPLWGLIGGAASLLAGAPLNLPDDVGEFAVGELGRMLRGTNDVPRDPRQALGMLLALEVPGWPYWVLKNVRRELELRGQQFWLLVLEAEALTRLSLHEDAAVAWEAIAQRVPDFLPAWERQERVLAALYPDQPHHTRILSARELRSKLLGREAGLDHQESVLLQASRAYSNERPEAAIELLERMLGQKSESELPAARMLLARAHTDLGHYSAAAEQFRQVLAVEEPRSDHPWIPEYLALLQRASSGTVPLADRLEPATVEDHLEALAARFPADPMVALAQLEDAVKSDPRNIQYAVRRAQAALRSLREASQGRTLEDLRIGSSRAWTDWLLERSPDQAERELRADLVFTPGDTELWLGLGRTLRAQGLNEQAEQHWNDVLALSDDPEAHLEIARLLTLRGGDRDAMRAHLEIVDHARGKEDSPMSRFLLVRGELYSRGKVPNATVRELESLWNSRDELENEVPPLELGRLYATALFVRAGPDELAKLEAITAELGRYAVRDPYAPGLVKAYRGLAAEAIRQREEAIQKAAEAEEQSDAETDEETAEASAGGEPR